MANEEEMPDGGGFVGFDLRIESVVVFGSPLAGLDYALGVAAEKTEGGG